jgi:hypothetical protein
MVDDLPLEMISKYGERYSRLIYSSLAFLADNEASWGLDEPMDRQAYVEGIIQRAIVV